MSLEYRTNLAKNLEEAGKGQAAMHVCNINLQEEDLTMARRIKYIEDKFRKSGTTFFPQQ